MGCLACWIVKFAVAMLYVVVIVAWCGCEGKVVYVVDGKIGKSENRVGGLSPA